MRPRQWLKNALVFLPLLFSVKVHWNPRDATLTLRLIGLCSVAFVLLCLLSSAVYLVNDLMDVESDRLHPHKRLRPLASGLLPTWLAWTTAAVLVGFSLPLALAMRLHFGMLALAYLGVALSYVFVLKHVVLLDLFALAAGFLLRTVAGAVLIGIPVSPWLYICITLGALFIGVTKRRQELVLLADGASRHRPILREYNLTLIDQLTQILATAALIAYALYTFSAEHLPQNHAMLLTSPFVLFGIFRYLYLVHVRGVTANPEDLVLGDKPLLIDILLWLVTATAILVIYR